MRQVAVGQGYSLVLTTAGQLYAFGDNLYGQLGNSTHQGTGRANRTPTLVKLPGRIGAIAQIAAGQGHSVAVTAGGQLYAWGKNDDGELGNSTHNGNFRPDSKPTLVRLPGRRGGVKQVAAGNDFTLALTASGQLYSFGQNENGELGDAQHNGSGVANPAPRLVRPPGLVGSITHIAAGGVHSLVVSSSGQLYAFGENGYGELGSAVNNGTNAANPVPTLVTLPGRVGPVTQVSAGDTDSLALTAGGQLYAFGSNDYGQLGDAVNVGKLRPNPVPTLLALPGRRGAIEQIAAGLTDSLVLTASGQLYTFGENNFGQLGFGLNRGTHNPNSTPKLARFPGGTKITMIAEGSEASQTLAFCRGCRRSRG